MAGKKNSRTRKSHDSKKDLEKEEKKDEVVLPKEKSPIRFIEEPLSEPYDDSDVREELEFCPSNEHQSELNIGELLRRCPHLDRHLAILMLRDMPLEEATHRGTNYRYPVLTSGWNHPLFQCQQALELYGKNKYKTETKETDKTETEETYKTETEETFDEELRSVVPPDVIRSVALHWKYSGANLEFDIDPDMEESDSEEEEDPASQSTSMASGAIAPINLVEEEPKEEKSAPKRKRGVKAEGTPSRHGMATRSRVKKPIIEVKKEEIDGPSTCTRSKIKIELATSDYSACERKISKISRKTLKTVKFEVKLEPQEPQESEWIQNDGRDARRRLREVKKEEVDEKHPFKIPKMEQVGENEENGLNIDRRRSTPMNEKRENEKKLKRTDSAERKRFNPRQPSTRRTRETLRPVAQQIEFVFGQANSLSMRSLRTSSSSRTGAASNISSGHFYGLCPDTIEADEKDKRRAAREKAAAEESDEDEERDY